MVSSIRFGGTRDEHERHGIEQERIATRLQTSARAQGDHRTGGSNTRSECHGLRDFDARSVGSAHTRRRACSYALGPRPRRLSSSPRRPSDSHDREAFDSGEPKPDEFSRRYARQNEAKGLSRTYVAVHPGESRVLGFYAVSSGAITFENVPERLPKYPIPVAHLGRLAVDRSVRGQGLGEFLLVDALRRVTLVAEQLGIYAVEVWAKNELARNFYLKYGFTLLVDDQFHLYLPMQVIRRLEFDE
jgi:GNAT superfamily N-acetyltransferase